MGNSDTDKVVIGVQLPRSEKRRLRILAAEQDRSVGATVRIFIRIAWEARERRRLAGEVS